MKTVGINKGMKKLIESVAEDGETVDATLNRLLDMVDLPSEQMDSTKTNIRLSDETFQKLNNAKIYSTEPHNTVIFRLIHSQK